MPGEASQRPAGVPESARCATCGVLFQFNRQFYEEHKIHCPSRCRACRRQRAARLIPKTGVVTRATAEFVIIENMGTRYIGFHVPLIPGDGVTFCIDSGQVLQPGQLAIALRVKRAAP